MRCQEDLKWNQSDFNYIHRYDENLLWLLLMTVVLFMHWFHICKFVFSLKFIGNSRTSTHTAWPLVHVCYSKSRECPNTCSQLRSYKVMLWVFASIHIIDKWPFCSLLGAVSLFLHFSAFCRWFWSLRCNTDELFSVPHKKMAMCLLRIYVH